MKRKWLAIALSMVLAVGMLSGCGDSNETPATDDTQTEETTSDTEDTTEAEEEPAAEAVEDLGGTVLNIWSWDTSFETRMETYYPDLKDGKIGDVTVNFVVQSDGDKIIYQQKLDEQINAQKDGGGNGDDIVDLFCAESDFIGKYGSAALNATYTFDELGFTDDQFANTLSTATRPATDENGKLRGINIEGGAAGMIVRKSIAEDVLGASDPDTVQAAVADWDAVKSFGEQCKAKGYYLYVNPDDFQRVYIMSDSTAFGADGTVSVTPGMSDWISFAKEISDAGYVENPASTMFDDVYMKSFAKDSKVALHTFTAWFSGWPMPGNADGTEGDWVLVQGPQPFVWGGTYLCAARGTDNADLVRDIITKMAIDEDSLYAYGKDGNYTNNKNVNAKLAEEGAKSDYFGDQDYYTTLYTLAAAFNTDGGGSAYDSQCVEYAWPILADYFAGKTDDLDACISTWQDEVIKTWANLTK